jgi:hypothetical protein
MQGGDQLCQIACETSISIRQLKVKVEVESGLKAAALAIYLPEVAQPLGQNVTLADCGLPSVLITLTLHKITIADMLDVSPGQLTDAQLAQACSTDEGKAGDLVDLAGCATIREMSCLVGLEQMQELNISGCTGIDATTVATVVAKNRTLSALIFGDRMGEPATLEVGMTEADFSNKNLGIKGAIIIYAWITHKDKGAMTSLDLANNRIVAESANIYIGNIFQEGELVDCEGVQCPVVYACSSYYRVAQLHGIIAISNAIPGMGALTSLNLSSNWLDAEGAKIVAKAIKVTMCTPAIIMAPFSCPSDFSINCCCLTSQSTAVVCYYPQDMGAMTSPNLASNELGVEGAKIVAEAIKVTKCTPAIVLAPFSCPSDFSINCCCLLLSVGYGGYDEAKS